MIVAQIVASRHRGCWASDTSLKFPGFKYLLFLVNYDSDHYEVITRFIPKDSTNLHGIFDVLGAIRDHPLWWGFDPIEGLPSTVRLIKIRDMGKCEGLIRPVLYERDADFPEYQLMEVDNGKETIYAVFDNYKSLKRVEKTLKERIGRTRISINTISENATRSQVVDLIPTWYDAFMSKGVAQLVKKSIKLKEEERGIPESVLEKIKKYLEKHPEICSILLSIIQRISDFFRFSID